MNLNEKNNISNYYITDEIIDEVVKEEENDQYDSNENLPSTPIKNDDIVCCPNCGSSQIEFVTYQASSNFDAGDACCGYFLCGPLGLLCGAKKKTEAKTVRKCKKCGKEF